MLIFLHHNLAFLATPKTGTTAVEMALKPHADIIFSKRRKHLNAVRYHRKVAPFLQDTFGKSPESVAVMRDPIDQIKSWYRYRSAARLDGTAFSTKALSFDEFVLDVIAADPPPHAQIGSQLGFLANKSGVLMVDHLFCYKHQTQFRAFLSEALDKAISFGVKNVSPQVDTALSARVEAQLRDARAAEFALYDRLIAADGHLGPA